MTAHLVGLLALTELHPGAGEGGGAIDLPVAREATTGFPVEYGSGHKGAFRVHLGTGQKAAFGEAASQGPVAFTDLFLLLLPVRSDVGPYLWVTSPYLLERLDRMLDYLGFADRVPLPCPLQEGEMLAPAAIGAINTEARLEELHAKRTGDLPAGLAALLGKFIPSDKLHETVQTRLAQRLAIVRDDDLAWLVENALPVSARNKLDPVKKTAETFWTEERLPADTLLFGAHVEKVANGTFAPFAAAVQALRYIQIGGNETVGQGICRVQVWSKP